MMKYLYEIRQKKTKLTENIKNFNFFCASWFTFIKMKLIVD